MHTSSVNPFVEFAVAFIAAAARVVAYAIFQIMCLSAIFAIGGGIYSAMSWAGFSEPMTITAAITYFGVGLVALRPIFVKTKTYLLTAVDVSRDELKIAKSAFLTHPMIANNRHALIVLSVGYWAKRISSGAGESFRKLFARRKKVRHETVKPNRDDRDKTPEASAPKIREVSSPIGLEALNFFDGGDRDEKIEDLAVVSTRNGTNPFLDANSREPE
jgi:hypothetical protein